MLHHRLYFIFIICILLTACGKTAGSLSLPPDYVEKHATEDQPTAPSASLAPLHYWQ